MASGQQLLSEFISDQLTPDAPQPWTLIVSFYLLTFYYHVLGAILKAYHKLHSRPNSIITALKEAFQLPDLGQPVTGTDQQVSK